MKEGMFIELNYTGKTSEGVVFDTTDAEVAKKAGLSPDFPYKPAIICLGQSFVLPAIDAFLMDKNVGETYTLTLSPENAFGKKDAKKIQLVSQSKFSKQNVQPYPGLQVDMDGQMAVIRRVSGGRVLVDFNHPLAGQSVVYDLAPLKEVTDSKEKLDAVLGRIIGNIPTTVADGVATLETDLPSQLQSVLEEQIKKLIPEITKITFKESKKETKEVTKGAVPKDSKNL